MKMKKRAMAGAGLAIPLTVIGWIGWIGWKSNAWQTHLIKIDLRAYATSLRNRQSVVDSINERWELKEDGVRLSGVAVFSDIAKAFVYAGDSQLALQVVNRISDDYEKADALRELAESYVKLGDKEKANALFSDAIKTAERIADDNSKVYALGAIAVSIARLGDKGKAVSLLSEGVKVAERIGGHGPKDWALKAIARSHAEAGETMKDITLLEEAIKTTERISYPPYKAPALTAIADSYIKLGDKEKARAILSDAINKTMKRTGFDEHKDIALQAIVRCYAKLGDKEKERALLEDAIKILEQNDERTDERTKERNLLLRVNSYSLRTIVVYLGRLDKEKARALLSKVGETAKRIGSSDQQALAWKLTVESYILIGEKMKDIALLEEATKILENSDDNAYKAVVLTVIADSYARLGDKEKARALLSDAIKTAGLIARDSYSRARVLKDIAISLAQLGEMMKDSDLLEEAIKTVDRISADRSSDFYANVIREMEVSGAILNSHIKAAKESNDPSSYNELRLTVGFAIDFYKNQALEAILSSKLAIADVGKLRSLTPHFQSEMGKAMALARILMACSRPDLIEEKSSLNSSS